MEQLLEYLGSIPMGTITSNNELDSLLANCWDEFNDSREGGMEPYKLHGRMEEISWNPPVLNFKIERHGGTVNGSTRAEIQQWEVNLKTCLAKCYNVGFRQIKAMQSKMNVKPMAEEIVALILEQRKDSRLKWSENGSVQIVTGNIIPTGSACKQTIQSRRKRFREEVERLLLEHGWQKLKTNIFAQSVSGQSHHKKKDYY